jgi:dihydropteroate synthase
MSLQSPIECGRYELSESRPLVMGVVNVTPDSFSDGGKFFDPEAAIAHALQLLRDGADILDIGAESTRPGAPPVSLEEELKRLLPVVKGLRDCGAPLSVDTRKPQVMRFVLKLGADMINDVTGFASADALEAMRSSNAAACVMHMLGEPGSMQNAPYYGDVFADVSNFLFGQAAKLRAAGVGAERIVLDPGIGFGKTCAHNLTLLSGLPQMSANGYPILVGLSRKSVVGEVTGREKGERMAGSLGAAVAAAALGARIVRVHDVKETVDALRMWTAMSSGRIQNKRAEKTVQISSGV